MPTIPDFPVYYRKTVRPTGIPELYKIYRISSLGYSCYAASESCKDVEFPATTRPAQFNARVYIRIWESIYDAVHDPFHSDPL